MTHRVKAAAATALLATAAASTTRPVAASLGGDERVKELIEEKKRVNKKYWDAPWATSMLAAARAPFDFNSSCWKMFAAADADGIVSDKWTGLELVGMSEKDTDDWRATHKYVGTARESISYSEKYGNTTSYYTKYFWMPFWAILGEGRVAKDEYQQRDYEVGVPTKVTKVDGTDDFLVDYDKADEKDLQALRSEAAAAHSSAVTVGAVSGVAGATGLLGGGFAFYLSSMISRYDECALACAGIVGACCVSAGIFGVITSCGSCSSCREIEKTQAVLEHKHCHAHVNTGKLLKRAEAVVQELVDAAKEAAEAKAAEERAAQEAIAATQAETEAGQAAAEGASLAAAPAHPALAADTRHEGVGAEVAQSQLAAPTAKQVAAAMAVAKAVQHVLEGREHAEEAMEELVQHCGEMSAEDTKGALVLVHKARAEYEAMLRLETDEEVRAQLRSGLQLIDAISAKITPASACVVMFRVLAGLALLALLSALAVAAWSKAQAGRAPGAASVVVAEHPVGATHCHGSFSAPDGRETRQELPSDEASAPLMGTVVAGSGERV